MVRLPAEWASKERQKPSPVMAIGIFLPIDDRKAWINQFISTFPKVPIESGKQWVIPIRSGAVEASESMIYASKRGKIYDVKSSR